MAQNERQIKKSVTSNLAELTLETTFEDLSDATVRETKRHIFDTLSAGLCALSMEKADILLELAEEEGGKPVCSIPGTEIETSPLQAAFNTGELYMSADYEPVALNTAHLIPMVQGAILPIAERENVTGKELITATAAGYEIAARLAMALNPLIEEREETDNIAPVQGFSYAALGAAAGAGKLLNLDRDELLNALGVAGYTAQVPSLYKWTITRPTNMVKFSSSGWIAEAGLKAALLAEKGFTGDKEVLDGDYGFWRFWGADECEWDVLTHGRGGEFYIADGGSYKLWPCCSLYRPHLWMVDKLVEEHELTPDEIDELVMRIHPIPANCENYTTYTVDNEMQAGFAGRYPITASLLDIEPGAEWLQPENFTDPEVEAFMQKIRIEEESRVAEVIKENEDNAEAGYERMPASVEITAGDKTVSEYVEYAKGDMWAPQEELRASNEELRQKFYINAEGILPEDQQSAALEVLTDLETFKDAATVVDLFTP